MISLKTLVVASLVFTSFPVSSFNADEATNFKAMTYEQLQKIDKKSLSRKERKSFKKLLKIKKKEAKKLAAFNSAYGHMLHEGKVALQEVVVIENVSPANMYASAKQWLSNPSNQFKTTGSAEKSMFSTMLDVEFSESDFPPIVNGFRDRAKIIRDDQDKTLMAHLVVHDQNKGGMTNNIRAMFYEYNIRIDFKEGRYRIKVTDITYNNWNHLTVKEFPIYIGKCAMRGSAEELIHCPKQQKGIRKTMTKFYTSVQEAVNTLKVAIASDKGDDMDF